MSGRPWKPWATQPHGTEARARRHYRAGDKPLRRFCPACADAEQRAKWGRRYGANVIPLTRRGAA